MNLYIVIIHFEMDSIFDDFIRLSNLFPSVVGILNKSLGLSIHIHTFLYIIAHPNWDNPDEIRMVGQPALLMQKLKAAIAARFFCFVLTNFTSNVRAIFICAPIAP